MKKGVVTFLGTLMVFSTGIGCKEEIKLENPLFNKISTIKSEFAPDKRVALFDVAAIKNKETYVLIGESNLPDAVTALKEKLISEKLNFIDSIQLLPSADLGDQNVGLITISVANLRSNPKHSAELATQVTLGTPVKILKKEDTWSLIQTPDGYLSWVDDGGIVPMTPSEMATWKTATKVIFTQITGNTYVAANSESRTVSDIVAGGILVLLKDEKDFYRVKYPDNRIAFVRKDQTEIYSDWLATTTPTQANLVDTSKKLMGLPYLWGGTSLKGVDCSGFTKTIYFLNGMIIPRDASQQVHTREAIDTAKDFEKLALGDLLFFGRQATDSTSEKVVHVGMWIGNNEFIHASGQVKINSVDKNAPNFDTYNLNRYLRTKRLVNSNVGALVNLKQTPVFKD